MPPGPFPLQHPQHMLSMEGVVHGGPWVLSMEGVVHGG